ncbi:hypothetical protein P8452_10869 [Trifolium repens]|nr:hypothetical protein P8452_10869 [Trifolium repens]
MASQDEVGKTIDQSIVSVINGFIQIQVFSYTGDFAVGLLSTTELMIGYQILEDIINDHNEAKSRVAKLVWSCSFGRCMENSKDLLDYYFTAKFRF